MATLTVALAEELFKASGGLEPMGDRIIVLRDPEKEQIGSIIVADAAKKPSFYGTVVAVGAGRYEKGQLLPMRLEPGDRILFGFHSGHDLPEDVGKRLTIMREDEVLAKL